MWLFTQINVKRKKLHCMLPMNKTEQPQWLNVVGSSPVVWRKHVATFFGHIIRTAPLSKLQLALRLYHTKLYTGNSWIFTAKDQHNESRKSYGWVQRRGKGWEGGREVEQKGVGRNEEAGKNVNLASNLKLPQNFQKLKVLQNLVMRWLTWYQTVHYTAQL